MEPMIKVECVECNSRYYVLAGDRNLLLPGDIKQGEAFPNRCPLCKEGAYAVLAEEAK